jgi:hypothetical protein
MLKPDQATGGSMDFYVSDEAVSYKTATLSYPPINAQAPVITHTPQTELPYGEDYPIEARVNNNGLLINAVEVNYLDAGNTPKTVLLSHRSFLDKPNDLVYQGAIPKGDMPESMLTYKFTVRTPYSVVSQNGNGNMVQVTEVDPGIVLKPTTVNNTADNTSEVSWSWSGKTIQLSDKFQLWAGDKMITETTKLNYSIPVTECDRYQAVKVRAHVKPGSDHPRAGQWSLYSAEGERFVGEKGLITEKDTVNKLFECLEKKKATSVSAFISSQKEYQASANVSLYKAAYYLTGVMNTDLQDSSLPEYLPYIFLYMNYINSVQFDENTALTDAMRKEILYKLIWKTNHTNDFDAFFKNAVKEMSRRMMGDYTM